MPRLRPEYAVDETVMMANFGAGGQTGFHPDMMGNQSPKVTLNVPETMTVSAGEPVTLSAVAMDDGKPSPRSIPILHDRSKPLRAELSYGAPAVLVQIPWDRARWCSIRHRPRSGRTTATAGTRRGQRGGRRRRCQRTTPIRRQRLSASQGTYVLRALGHDGGLVDYKDVTITVTR